MSFSAEEEHLDNDIHMGNEIIARWW